MEEKILKLIYDYSKKHHMVDKNFIEQIIDIVINNKSLNKYLKEVDYIDEKKLATKKVCILNIQEFADLTYNDQTRVMGVCLDNIPKIYNQIDEISLSDYESMFSKNIIYTRKLLHELEHVNQNKIKTEEDSLESKIISVSLPCPKENLIDERMSKEEQLKLLVTLLIRYAKYQESYQYNPVERMAEADSFRSMIDILMPDQKKFPNIMNYLENMVDKSLIEGYVDSFSPIIRCLESLGEEQSLITFDWYSENEEQCLEKSIKLYDFDRRLKCGLPIEENKRLQLIKKCNINIEK